MHHGSGVGYEHPVDVRHGATVDRIIRARSHRGPGNARTAGGHNRSLLFAVATVAMLAAAAAVVDAVSWSWVRRSVSGPVIELLADNEPTAHVPFAADDSVDVASGPEPTAPEAVAPVGCSASGMSHPPSSVALPGPVADTRQQLISAAIRCDYETLAFFSAGSFAGPAGTPLSASGWADAERTGEHLTAELVRLLAQPAVCVCTDDRLDWVWPETATVAWADLTEAQRSQVAAQYGPASLDEMDRIGGYVGYRLSIDHDGRWLAFNRG